MILNRMLSFFEKYMKQEKDNSQEGIELLFEQETFKVRGAIFEVYRQLGCGFLEGIDQECLEKEFQLRGITFVSQQEIVVYYKGEKLLQKYKPDFICFGQIIVELKAVLVLAPEHKAQIFNYLKITGNKIGLLVNFGHFPKAEIERFIL